MESFLPSLSLVRFKQEQPVSVKYEGFKNEESGKDVVVGEESAAKSSSAGRVQFGSMDVGVGKDLFETGKLNFFIKYRTIFDYIWIPNITYS